MDLLSLIVYASMQTSSILWASSNTTTLSLRWSLLNKLATAGSSKYR